MKQKNVTKQHQLFLLFVSRTYSNGMSFAQLTNVFMALGVKDAINMDGGGSSTLVIREGSNFAVKNSPSGGVQRAVANAWTIVDTQ